MPNIARSINRPLPVRPNNAQKTRVLLLRQPIKSVRREDESPRSTYHLLLGTLIAVGVIALTWLIGHLGYRLGFAQMLGVPELLLDPGGGLATGALMIMTVPLRIVEAGVAQPMWLMLAFVMILAPAGGLAAARPQVRGGPKPTQLALVGWWTASIVALLASGLVVAYVVSPIRMAWVMPLPDALDGVDQWLAGWSVAAGLDGLLVVAAALWMVLAFRVTVPMWMKALSISGCLFALAVAVVAMSMTNATVVHLQMQRSVVQFGPGMPARVLLGYTRHHAATVQIEPESGSPVVTMFDVPTEFRATGRESIARMLLDAQPEEEF